MTSDSAKPLSSATLAIFLAGMAFTEAARTMSMVQIPVYLRELGAEIGEIGLFFTLSMVFPLALRILGGWLSDTMGRLRALALGAMAGAGGFIVFGLAPTWQLALMAPFFLAITTSLAQPSFKAYVADHTREEMRGRVFGLAETTTTLAWIVGPPLGGLVAQGFGYRWMLAASAIAYLVALLIFLALAFASAPEPPPGSPPSLKSLHLSLREMLGLLLAGGLMTWVLITDGVRDISFELSFDLMPVYLSDIMGISKQGIGFLDGIFGIALAAASYPAGWLIDKTSERLGILLGLITVILSRVVFAFATSFWGFAFSWILLGIGAGLMDPAYSSLIAKGVPRHLRGIAYGLLATSLGVISLPSPWIGSQIWELYGPMVPFLLTAALGCLALVPAWLKLVAPKGAETAGEAAAPFYTGVGEGQRQAGLPAMPGATVHLGGLRSAPPDTATHNILAVLIAGVERDPRRVGPAQPLAHALNQADVAQALVAIVRGHGGKAELTSPTTLEAFFSEEHDRRPGHVAAWLAVDAALDLVDRVHALASSEGLRLGIGIAAGGLTGPGDTEPDLRKRLLEVGTQIQQLAMRLGRTSLLITDETNACLGAEAGRIEFGRHGNAALRPGRREILIHEVLGRRAVPPFSRQG